MILHIRYKTSPDEKTYDVKIISGCENYSNDSDFKKFIFDTHTFNFDGYWESYIDTTQVNEFSPPSTHMFMNSDCYKNFLKQYQRVKSLEKILE